LPLIRKIPQNTNRSGQFSALMDAYIIETGGDSSAYGLGKGWKFMNYRDLVDSLATTSFQGIRFKDRLFSDPKRFPGWSGPQTSGLYAILVPDQGWSPRPFRPIYFGECQDFSKRVSTSHEKYPSWIREAKAPSRLFVAVHYMPSSTQDGRRALESELIAHYEPVCNEVFNPLFRLLQGPPR